MNQQQQVAFYNFTFYRSVLYRRLAATLLATEATPVYCGRLLSLDTRQSIRQREKLRCEINRFRIGKEKGKKGKEKEEDFHSVGETLRLKAGAHSRIPPHTQSQ